MLLLKFNSEFLKMCLSRSNDFQRKLLEKLPTFISNITNSSNKALAIYFFQNEERDISTLQLLSQCIGLFHHPLYPVRGLYKGSVRFMLRDHQAVLVGTKSFFYAFKPEHTSVVKFDSACKCLINLIL